MEYIRNTTDFYVSEDTAVSLGKFDGIHRGHIRLLEHLKKKKKDGQKTVIFTFDIPPRQRIDGTRQFTVLTTNEEKMQLLEQHGIDYLIECPFTSEMMLMEPEDFVKMIVERLHIKSIAAGTDFRFGHNRKGDYLLLKKLADVYGYDMEIVDKVQENGKDISSTYIREEVLAGRMEQAEKLLGCPYFVQGMVIHGNEIGRTMQVPTANLKPPEEKLLPPFGVYVTRTTIFDGTERVCGGITNVGCKPTVQGRNSVGVETHLFDFHDWIYGKRIKVEFLGTVRPEKKFASLEELKKQMHKDIVFGIKYYANITKIC